MLPEEFGFESSYIYPTAIENGQDNSNKRSRNDSDLDARISALEDKLAKLEETADAALDLISRIKNPKSPSGHCSSQELQQKIEAMKSQNLRFSQNAGRPLPSLPVNPTPIDTKDKIQAIHEHIKRLLHEFNDYDYWSLLDLINAIKDSKTLENSGSLGHYLRWLINYPFIPVPLTHFFPYNSEPLIERWKYPSKLEFTVYRPDEQAGCFIADPMLTAYGAFSLSQQLLPDRDRFTRWFNACAQTKKIKEILITLRNSCSDSSEPLFCYHTAIPLFSENIFRSPSFQKVDFKHFVFKESLQSSFFLKSKTFTLADSSIASRIFTNLYRKAMKLLTCLDPVQIQTEAINAKEAAKEVRLFLKSAHLEESQLNGKYLNYLRICSNYPENDAPFLIDDTEATLTLKFSHPFLPFATIANCQLSSLSVSTLNSILTGMIPRHKLPSEFIQKEPFAIESVLIDITLEKEKMPPMTGKCLLSAIFLQPLKRIPIYLAKAKLVQAYRQDPMVAHQFVLTHQAFFASQFYSEAVSSIESQDSQEYLICNAFVKTTLADALLTTTP